jgi:type IV pilus assembly protein PilM
VQAEEYKKAYGLDSSVLEGKVAQALIPSFGQIVEQIQKTINFYLQKNPNEVIKRLILSGGTALMPGITTFLTQKLGLETVIGDPFAQFIKDKNFPQELVGKGTRFATAAGLAMREG